MADPVKKSEERINKADAEIYKVIPSRARREFRYSDRRLFKQLKMFAVSALANVARYCAFLGPSGVSLAAPDKAKPVLTWLRYPVSYRRRMRFLKDFAKSQGAVDGVSQTVFYGKEDDAYLYLSLVNDKDACVAAAKDASDEHKQELAILCCNLNGWLEYLDPSDGGGSSDGSSDGSSEG